MSAKPRITIVAEEPKRDAPAAPAYPTAPAPEPAPAADAPAPAAPPAEVAPAPQPSAGSGDGPVQVRVVPDPPAPAPAMAYPTGPTKPAEKKKRKGKAAAGAKAPRADLRQALAPLADLAARLGLVKRRPQAGLAELDRVLLQAIGREEQIRPAFSGTWIAPKPPREAKVVKEYDLPGCRVQVCTLDAETEGLYHATPEEYALPDDEMRLLLAAKEALARDLPESLELTNIAQTREYVTRRGTSLLADLHERGTHPLSGTPAEVRMKVDRLARILARYTAGYGALEILLSDPLVSDIYINAPALLTPVRVTLHTRGELPQKCRTNFNLTQIDEDSLLSRLRYESGRPFSEAYPVLDADLSLFGARAAVIGPPLSPKGLAVALRRHALEPWTLPRLIDRGSISPLAAGLLSTLIQAQCTLIIAGGRGSGKTSLLSALLFEIPLGNRILTVEDTPEIPVAAMQANGYQVQALLVRSSVGGGQASEMSASDALKIAMRLGESAIIMGEVRGDEARTLYESMRAGTAGSTVLGTFHGDSASSVYERAVHDMGIPANSFAATDAVVIAGLVRRGASTQFVRRLVQVAEFDKRHPETGTFHDLLQYDVGKEDWVVTDHMQRSSHLFSRIGAKWGLGYFDTMRLVETRATVFAHLVERSRELKRPEILGAATVPRVNGIVQAELDAQPLAGADHDAIIERIIRRVEATVIAQ